MAHGSDYDVTVKEIDVGPLQVQGPKSKDVMVDLFGQDILEIPYYFMRPFEVDGMNVLVSRTGYTAELGFEIYLYEASRTGSSCGTRCSRRASRTISRSSGLHTSAGSRAASSPSAAT